MKSYVEKNFDKEYLKGVDIQNVGVYYNVPIENIEKDRLAEFDIEEGQTSISLDHHTIYTNNFIVDTCGIDYDFTDEMEIDSFINDLMNYKAYDHYLVVLFNSKWNGASGYKIFNKYDECFYRDYDCSMYVTGASAKGKYLQLREYHHDCPMGHTSIIIGLTEKEYQKLDSASIDDIIEYGKQSLNKIIEL